MTFGQLQTAVYQVCGYPPPVQPIVVARVKNWLNEAHRHCLRQPGLVELRQRSGLQFITTPGKAIYTFPLAFERVDAVVERTSHRRLRSVSRDIFRTIDPGETSTGTPTCYVPEGWQVRIAVPTIGNAYLWAASDWAADTTQQVRVVPIRHTTSDMRVTETATLNGLTPVILGGVVGGPAFGDHEDIAAFTLSSTCIGDVFLYQGTNLVADTTFPLSYIPPGSTSAQYWCLRLWPTPSGAVQYFVDGQIEIPDLIYETDIPLLPPSYHDLLGAFARMREYERTGDSRFALSAGEWERGVRDLRAFVNFPDDWKPIAGSMDTVNRGSNLGGFFPSDWGWP